jgi:hypothetical protein
MELEIVKSVNLKIRTCKNTILMLLRTWDTVERHTYFHQNCMRIFSIPIVLAD